MKKPKTRQFWDLRRIRLHCGNPGTPAASHSFITKVPNTLLP